MKFFVRYLPNGKVLVRNIDSNVFLQPQIVNDMKEAADFMQNAIDTYGSIDVDFSDPTGIEGLRGDK